MQESDNVLLVVSVGAALSAALLACTIVVALFALLPFDNRDEPAFANAQAGSSSQAHVDETGALADSPLSSGLAIPTRELTVPTSSTWTSEDVERLRDPLQFELSSSSVGESAGDGASGQSADAVSADNPPDFSEKVEFYPQFPEVPGACEIASMVSVLRAMGFDIDAVRFTDEYVLSQPGDRDMVDGYGGDPYVAGGAFPPIMARSGNAFLRSQGSDWRFVERKGALASRLVNVAEGGRPVIVWTTMSLEPALHTGMVTKGYEWYENEHCVALCGRTDDASLLVMDPLVGMVDYDESRFAEAYRDSGGYALVLSRVMTEEVDDADEQYLLSFANEQVEESEVSDEAA